MATLSPTLTLNSQDAGSDILNFTVTDVLSVTKDVITNARIALSNTDLTLLAAASYGTSYVYLKNTDTSIAINVDFGSTLGIKLSAGEFAFFPWEGSQNIVVVAASGTPVLEYGVFEA